MDTSFWIAIAALIAALTVDFINLTLLVRLKRWSEGAVDEIIGAATSEIMKRINLQVGKSGSTMQKLTEKFAENLTNADQSLPENLQGINLPLLFAKIQSGNLDLKDFIPIAAKMISSRPDNGNSSTGQWK
jgi:hypothetical protein